MSFIGKTVGTLIVLMGAAYVMEEANIDFGSPASAQAAGPGKADIPGDYLALYQEVGQTCPQVDWALLAGIGKVESDHGRSPLPGVHSGVNTAGVARGPMQFTKKTWNTMRERHPDIGDDVYNPAHAIPAAAYLLCDETARLGSVEEAVHAYNHDPAYVKNVTDQAAAYRGA